jgi:hypothetical protein
MPKILVTGCQRSGTRFYAKFLAEQHRCLYIDETDYETRDTKILYALLHCDKESWVVHGPAIKTLVTMLWGQYSDMQTIWMYRDRDETIASMRRLKWAKHAHKELVSMIPYITDNESEVLLGQTLDDVYAEQLGVFGTVWYLSFMLGYFLMNRDFVTLKNMREIEHLPGFRKSTTI